MTEQRASAVPGRPRDPRVAAAVRDATRALLVEVGYPRLSYELIAQRAGVSRPTLYRRWPTKAHIVHDAVFPERPVEPQEDGGDFAGHLRLLIARLLASYARPEARVALPGLLTDLADPDLRRSVVDPLQRQVRAELADRVARAVADGELRAGVDADALLDVVVGTLLQRVVVQGDTDPGFAGQLAELLLGGLRPAR